MLNLGRGTSAAGLTMPGATRTGLALLGLAALWTPAATAASFDCSSRWLTRTEMTICDDPQLSRADDQLARRLRGFAQRRLNFGQYLGLRYWHAAAGRQRSLCRADRACILGTYRAQLRFLDQLQVCVDAGLARRSCLRELVGRERESLRR
jgi:uncharacterized protein